MNLSFGIFPVISIALAAVLYAVYYLWLRMKCQPRFTQCFILLALLATMLITFVHPVRVVPDEREVEYVPVSVSVASKAQQAIPQPVSEQLTTLMHTNLTKHPKTEYVAVTYSHSTSRVNILFLIYIIGVGGVVCYILLQLAWALRMRLSNKLSDRQDNVNIYDSGNSIPFSFGHNVFLPSELKGDMRRYVLLHERSHVRHRHFLWLCLAEVFVAILWFNPLAWLLLKELKLQQEMEVDAELMRGGVDRESYQMSLLRVCSNSGRWVLMQTAFGESPLKYRILFMNRRIYERPAWIRGVVAAVLLAGFFGSALALSFRTEKERNPLNGCWTMDWIRNTNDKYEHVPPLTSNLFYGNDMQINFSWFSRYGGVNMHFNFSGEQMPFRNGVLFNAANDTLHFTFLDANTHQMQWHKQPNQTTLVDGPDITEQWHRVVPEQSVVRLLHALYTSADAHDNCISGVWQATDDVIDTRINYFVVNGDLHFRFTLFAGDRGKYLRYGAGGWCGDFRYIDANTIFLSDRNASVSWQDSDHISVTHRRDNGTSDTFYYQRVNTLPDDFLLLLTAAFPKE